MPRRSRGTRTSKTGGRRAAGMLLAVAAVALMGAARGPDGPGGRAKSHKTPITVEAGRARVPGDTAAVRHLLSRATYGVRPQDLERALAMGPDAWLDEQLHPERIDDAELEKRLALFPAASLDVAELYEKYPPPQLLRRRLEQGDGRGREAGDRPGGERDAPPDPGASQRETQEEIQRLRRDLGLLPPGRILFDLASAKLQRAVYSERQLEEVMTDFWFNHFNVFFGKGPDRWLVGAYEREAIRPHVFGRFEDLLVATARHPAMQVYLDNWQNVAPDSLRPDDPRAERFRRLPARTRRRILERRGLSSEQIERLETAVSRQRERGLNENYARELLELHTLGVDGGYTQEDVIAVARAFTGWTAIENPGRGRRGAVRRRAGERDVPVPEFGFAFRPELHDPTDKIVLGVRIRGRSGDAGYGEGLEILRMLARSPVTARHVATKLATAFAADDPPPALVDELARTFLETDGDLREVTRTLFSSEHFLDPDLYGAKLKTPFELVASAARVSGARVGPSRAPIEALRAMGELPYMSQVPTGYSKESEDWSSSGALLQRVNFALEMAGGEMRGVRIPADVRQAAGDRPAAGDRAGAAGGIEAGDGDPGFIAEAVVGWIYPGMKAEEAEALARAIAVELAPEDDSPQAMWTTALGLALGAPAFQQR